MKEKRVNLNLQMFGEQPTDDNEDVFVESFDDEIEVREPLEIEDGYEDLEAEPAEEEGEEPEETSKEEQEEEQEEKQEGKPVKKPKSKEEYTIIQLKKQLKELKQREVERLRKESEEKQRNDLKAKYFKELVDSGYDESTARAKAENSAEKDLELQSIKRNMKIMQLTLQAQSLKDKYPDVEENIEMLADLCDKAGLTLEEACRAKLRPVSEYESRVKSETEAVIKRSKAKAANPGITPTKTSSEDIKLDKDEEMAYQLYINDPRYPERKKITRKEFMKM
jgi:hypothetical protein